MKERKKIITDNQVTRRYFISTSLLAMTATVMSPLFMNAQYKQTKFKAIAFDGFVIFDPRPVQMLLTELLAEKGVEFGTIWRSKQFEYTWLRTVSGKYKNFWEVTEDALKYTVKKTGVSLSTDNKQQLMQKFLELNIWPEAIQGLKELKQQGYRLAFLSNFTKEMMQVNIQNNKLQEYFEFQLSTDLVTAFKPSPLAYQMGINAFNLRKEEILFAAFGAWDATGAKSFGYPTYWVNRQHVPLEELDVTPDGTGNNFNDLMNFLKG